MMDSLNDWIQPNKAPRDFNDRRVNDQLNIKDMFVQNNKFSDIKEALELLKKVDDEVIASCLREWIIDAIKALK